MAEHLHQTHLLSAYLEDELSLIQRQTVEAHLKTCTVCLQELHLLRQTVHALQNLPPLTTSEDFAKKLYWRLHQRKGPQEEVGKDDSLQATEQSSLAKTTIRTSAVTASPIIVFLRKAPWLGRIFEFPLQVQLGSCVALFGLGLILWPPGSEEPPRASRQPQLQVAPPPGSAPRQVPTAPTNAIQPVDATVPSSEQPLLLDTTLPTAVEPLGGNQPVQWRMTGSEPALLRRQVKELAGQIEGARVVQEQEDLLLISLPTHELRTIRDKLSKLKAASKPIDELLPQGSTTLLSIMFIREPSVLPHP